ncbi:hypothetical protein AVEN_127910-1 [Araneus ventricosus]|uniref:Uncharacterized protein n=1 Tax=Araneus ventricosus TaxID=182803 RepID=A0A4Y1ZZ31_ARAVE|nr:hypothetical protein AVEN_127910-1 [Araneus ventricosus]
MDGRTKGPYSYSGPIGLLLKDCVKIPVVKFDCTLQHLDLKDIKKLSTDQQYLYRIRLAIKDGSCSSSATDNSPEPPLTMHIKDKDLKEMCKEQFPVMMFEEFPCHTQSVERCIKLISEASMKVCGETARDGYIRVKLQARKEDPTFDNKGQYYSNT